MGILVPVTDEKKVVTDPVVISMLEKQGMDKEYVEFEENYNKEHPYGKIYRDLQSNKQLLVSSGLPMARGTDGTLLVPGWEYSAGKYGIKNNLVEGYASTDGKLILSAVNDQPGGLLGGREYSWEPELYYGTELIEARSISILETDPINENYTDNIIEYDYGICKRRVRIIEGRVIGSWIFESDPGVNIRMVYRNDGGLPFRLGEYAVGEGYEELVTREAFANAVYPFTVRDTLTVYPDAHTETSTVDGYAAELHSTDISWATLIGSAGNYSNDSSNYEMFITLGTGGASNTWRTLIRSIFSF